MVLPSEIQVEDDGLDENYIRRFLNEIKEIEGMNDRAT